MKRIWMNNCQIDICLGMRRNIWCQIQARFERWLVAPLVQQNTNKVRQQVWEPLPQPLLFQPRLSSAFPDGCKWGLFSLKIANIKYMQTGQWQHSSHSNRNMAHVETIRNQHLLQCLYEWWLQCWVPCRCLVLLVIVLQLFWNLICNNVWHCHGKWSWKLVSPQLSFGCPFCTPKTKYKVLDNVSHVFSLLLVQRSLNTSSQTTTNA